MPKMTYESSIGTSGGCCDGHSLLRLATFSTGGLDVRFLILM